jgi:hypothetical protein
MDKKSGQILNDALDKIRNEFGDLFDPNLENKLKNAIADYEDVKKREIIQENRENKLKELGI